MKLLAITAREFSSLRWSAPEGYERAAADAVIALVLQEIPVAVLAMPVAFIPYNDEFTIAAVQGLQQGKNLFVAPDGRWKADYVPAGYRAYPFDVANTETGEQVLCFDQDSNLLTDKDGYLFCDETGELAGEVKKVAEFLTQVTQNREVTKNISRILKQHNLIEPWPIAFKIGNIDQQVNGLYRIDEQALRQLSAEALKLLSDAGALGVAYSQLLSTNQLPKLIELAIADAAAPGEKKSDDLDFLKEDKGTLDFSFL